jgi:hypothetical protein
VGVVDVLGLGEMDADIARSMPSDAASSSTRPESRSSRHAALSINATTNSEAIASARAKPVVRMMMAAMTVPMNP